MTQPLQPGHRPRRARRLDLTNLCLLFAAALATLPWLFAPDSGTLPAPRAAANAATAPVVTVATNNGVAT